ncbi:hypothetical protein AMAG_18505 [Allomyces macrogynus ATCC 38327]|uniref:Uncharacterized protein n=1 Tax=Allomyces macrogynus (strain ATCC 38327) TaxID=578462 RepID=A0A0L0SCW4_ALLM3|nr:hypothetical protein AMAG_18505 [Allomyces macrogynus ATCC 38327]|eukprot:KNE60282.1 hypothetical protein AMAG_18505 [Allomyces macrogynus ATCC 38327]
METSLTMSVPSWRPTGCSRIEMSRKTGLEMKDTSCLHKTRSCENELEDKLPCETGPATGRRNWTDAKLQSRERAGTRARKPPAHDDTEANQNKYRASRPARTDTLPARHQPRAHDGESAA